MLLLFVLASFRLADVVSRIRAGEPRRAVAADYGLHAAEVAALLELAA